MKYILVNILTIFPLLIIRKNINRTKLINLIDCFPFIMASHRSDNSFLINLQDPTIQ